MNNRANEPEQSAHPYWPATGWRTSAPEDQGMDPERLSLMLRRLYDEKKNVNSLLILRHGYLIMEAYFGPYTGASLHNLFSATKSVTATLVGVAIHNGAIPGLEATLVDLLPEAQSRGLSTDKQSITLEDLLAMVSGIRWNETTIAYSRAANPVTRMQKSDSWTRFVLEQPMAAQPGTRFGYHSGGSHLLSAIIQHRTGQPTAAYAEQKLFRPLGIEHYYWPADPDGIHTGSSGLQLRSADMAKIGTLYLQDGVWGGERLLPPGWVAAATEPRHHAIRANSVTLRAWNRLKRVVQPASAPIPAMDYGLHWWLPAFGGYAARGWGGQAIFVVPEYSLVVVFTGGLGGADQFLPDKLMTDDILPAMQPGLLPSSSVAPSEPLRWTPEPPLTAALSPSSLVGRISGRRYRPLSGKPALSSFSLMFLSNDEATLVIMGDGQERRIGIGLDGAYRTTETGKGAAVAARGAWTSESVFVIDWRQIDTGDRVDIALRFSSDEVELRSRSTLAGRTGRLRAVWDGVIADHQAAEADNDPEAGSNRL